MIVLSLDEFTAKRRTAQADIEERLRPKVEKAVDLSTNTSGWDDLLSTVTDIYFDVYQDEAGNVPKKAMPSKFRESLRETLRKTKNRDAASVDKITVWLATAILSRATLDASADDEADLFTEWVTMEDSDVRPEHAHANGQQRPVGEKFDIAGHKMDGPGDPSAPMELWQGCRCTLRPVLAEEAVVASAEETHTGLVITALPVSDDPIRDIPSNVEGGLHATILFFGDQTPEVTEKIKAAVQEMLDGWNPPPFSQDTEGRMEPLGHDDPQAQVLMMSSDARDLEYTLGNIRETLLANEDVKAAFDSIEQYPDYTPHVTLGYGELDPEAITAAEQLPEITFDRLAVWHGDEQTEYPLGAAMTTTETEAPVDETADPQIKADTRVPWHGILAPEDVRSGDGRRFKSGALSTRPLPLPLTWQKSSQEGHGGSVVVATIEKAEMVDGLMRASGFMLSTVEADEVIGLIGEFGRFGVSVDADESEFELNEEDETVDFTSARVCGASIVPIPAFAEAWVALGYWDDEDQTEPVDPKEMEPVKDEALAASIESMRSKVQVYKDLAPGKTEDGPGWLTHPVDTDRLRDYWVRGEGAAKIGWGTPGDFNRCRLAVAEYVKPQYLNGYCANRHYDALGFWPGRPVAGDTTPFAAETMELEDTEPAEAISMVASAPIKAPAAWFANPNLTEPTPVTVTDEGQVYGHIAAWGTCHIGFGEYCQAPPHSTTNYAHFLTGRVALDNGTYADTGPLTIGGGHANGRLGMKAAIEHYDSTSTAVCDVTCGEDEHGIWFSGWVRPGVTDEMVTALLASPLSGDWRPLGGGLEMIAALAVNTPGFAIPKTRIAASSEGQLSLVAAGVVPPRVEEPRHEGIDMEALGMVVARQIIEINDRKATMAALAATVNEKAGV